MSKQREALESILQMLGDPMSPLEAKIIVTAYEALAEPEQEPVADADLYAVWSNGFHSRKPLTDEQVEDEWERITGHSIFGGDRSEGRSMYLSPDEVIEFARAIERAHGIGD